MITQKTVLFFVFSFSAGIHCLPTHGMISSSSCGSVSGDVSFMWGNTMHNPTEKLHDLRLTTSSCPAVTGDAVTSITITKSPRIKPQHIQFASHKFTIPIEKLTPQKKLDVLLHRLENLLSEADLDRPVTARLVKERIKMLESIQTFLLRHKFYKKWQNLVYEILKIRYELEKGFLQTVHLAISRQAIQKTIEDLKPLSTANDKEFYIFRAHDLCNYYAETFAHYQKKIYAINITNQNCKNDLRLYYGKIAAKLDALSPDLDEITPDAIMEKVEKERAAIGEKIEKLYTQLAVTLKNSTQKHIDQLRARLSILSHDITALLITIFDQIKTVDTHSSADALQEKKSK